MGKWSHRFQPKYWPRWYRIAFGAGIVGALLGGRWLGTGRAGGVTRPSSASSCASPAYGFFRTCWKTAPKSERSEYPASRRTRYRCRCISYLDGTMGPGSGPGQHAMEPKTTMASTNTDSGAT